MPTYTYQCPECGEAFNLFHSMSDESEKHCPECDAVAKRRISGGAGLIFKGSGFYITDYKNGHDPAGGPTNGKNGSGNNGSEGFKKEIKEETKSKPKAEKTEKKATTKA